MAGRPVAATRARALRRAFSSQCLTGLLDVADLGRPGPELHARPQDLGDLPRLVRIGGRQDVIRSRGLVGRWVGQRGGLEVEQGGDAVLGEGQQLVQLARLNGAPSAVPWTSTNRPDDVMTTFMSTSARLSSM